MPNKLVELTRFHDLGQAQVAKSMLQSYGIDCELFDESANSTLWHIGLAMGGSRLMVAEDQLQKAAKLLENPETETGKEDKEI